MTITPSLFEAHLKCPTKCWLRSTGEPPSGNAYAEWVQTQNESYRADAAQRLTAGVPAEECIVSPVAESLKSAKWRMAVDVEVAARVSAPPSSGSVPLPERKPGGTPEKLAGRSADSHVRESGSVLQETRGLGGPRSEQLLESRLHAVERIPSEGRGKAAHFVPIRFIFRNKLTIDDKLLLAFDALVLSEMLGREIAVGKIIHGDDHVTLKVKTGARTALSARTSVASKGLVGEVRKRLEKIAALLSNSTPPDLVLNRHCAECEFQARCRKIAVEKDDLSLLAGMSAKERQKLRSKGIFTVTQLSYTFRPRRRPKRRATNARSIITHSRRWRFGRRESTLLAARNSRSKARPSIWMSRACPTAISTTSSACASATANPPSSTACGRTPSRTRGRFGRNSLPSSKPSRSRC